MHPTGSPEEFVAIVEKGVDPHVVVFHEPHSVPAEQFRGLRNSLVSLNPERAPRVLAVTSALRGEGKSVAVVNLACAFAELRETRVVLVDADLRDPSVEALLGIAPGPGLCEVLSGRLPLEQAVRPTFLRGLSFLGPGEGAEASAEILASGRLKPVLDALKESSHYILVDTPPALAVTDAGVIGRSADGILLVVRLESTPRARVEQAIAVLDGLGGNVLGIFLTGVPLGTRRKDAYAYR
ncbi:MAG TPA: CpsD/CapB family tyrosine-protein kinase [Planctomycetota bacterium]|nr:CpsD/CapB family tyrosine-protein kinase [Planctomycetota bacterium]